jgi:hypothetical protein
VDKETKIKKRAQAREVNFLGIYLAIRELTINGMIELQKS